MRSDKSHGSAPIPSANTFCEIAAGQFVCHDHQTPSCLLLLLIAHLEFCSLELNLFFLLMIVMLDYSVQ